MPNRETFDRGRRDAARSAAVAVAVAVALLVPASAGGVGREIPPPPGTSVSDVDRSRLAGAVRVANGWAVRLRAARPSWVTPDLLRRVRAARGAPVAAPAAAQPPADGGIRPGTLMVAPYGCTMNFVFRRRDDFAIGTAAHCVDRIGQHVMVLVRRPRRSAVLDVGRVVRRAYNERGLSPDFALVRIRERLEHLVGGAIMEIGGPCGVYRGGGIQTLRHFGYPMGLPPGIQRAGVSRAWRGATFTWAGAAIFGDSGSAVRTASYAAAGNLTGVVLATPGWIPGEMVGTRMTWIERFVRPWRLLDAAACV